jgi:hypothetical protein
MRIENPLKTGGPLPEHFAPFSGPLHGGGKGIRTPDLLIANETLYQLSYTPANEEGEDTRNAARPASTFQPRSETACGSIRNVALRSGTTGHRTGTGGRRRNQGTGAGIGNEKSRYCSAAARESLWDRAKRLGTQSPTKMPNRSACARSSPRLENQLMMEAAMERKPAASEMSDTSFNVSLLSGMLLLSIGYIFQRFDRSCGTDAIKWRKRRLALPWHAGMMDDFVG